MLEIFFTFQKVEWNFSIIVEICSSPITFILIVLFHNESSIYPHALYWKQINSQMKNPTTQIQLNVPINVQPLIAKMTKP